jgi:branched-chain amino acid transport system substrate-binding protein
MRSFIRITGAAAIAAALAAGPGLAQDVPGVTADTIKIGVIGPMTGSAAIFGKSVFGVEAVFQQANERGGIHGRKIEVVREDDACDPAKGLAAYKKVVSQDEVFAIDGFSCSGVAVALRTEIEKSGVPVMIMGAASGAVAAPVLPTLFQPVPTTPVVGQTMIDFAMSKPGTTKVAFVSHSDDWGKSNRDPAIKHLAEKYKLEPVLNLSMERGSTDATPQILQIRNSGAEFVVLMMYPAEVAIFVRDAFKYGLSVPMLGPQSVSLEDTRDRVGGTAAIQNLYVFYPYVDAFSSEKMKAWATLINKSFPEERVESFSFLGMGGAMALVDALDRAGPELTREKLVAALDETKDFQSGVLAAPISFSKDDHAGVKSGAMATFKGDDVVAMTTWTEK